MNNLRGKNLLVIGGTGTVGRVLVRRLMDFDPGVIRVFSRDEHKQYIMQSEFSMAGREQPMDRARFLLGDIRDKDRLKRAMEDIDIVFHLAALKHVPACEYNPFEAVKTNVVGTQNVIECAIEEGVETVVYASTDKAAGPTNTMGATKLLAERLISAADLHKGPRHTRFFSVRFGNILNSRGSVVPLFARQIESGGPVTVTDPEMTRFVMPVERAVELILKAVAAAHGGETFVFKMPVVKIGDMARAMVELDGRRTEIINIGLRPGEKMYEELLTVEESGRVLETDEMFIIIPYHLECGQCPQLYSQAVKALVKPYDSHGQDCMGMEEVKNMLKTACGFGHE